MKAGGTGLAPGRAIRRSTVAFVAVLAMCSAVALGAAVTPTGGPSKTACCASVQVAAWAVAADGSQVTSTTYRLGQEILLYVGVPSATDPVSVHQVINGLVFGELGWNVTATRYTYVIDSGPADTGDLGVNHGYVVVTFADGSSARSNNVTWTVTN